jgi:predicted alpha/beta hydrolase family esterase
MKKVIILHGMPSKEEYEGDESRKHWIPWLKEELEKQGYEVFNPELPNPYEPVYEDWLATFQQFPVDEDTILLGHSCGGGFLIRYLSENIVKVGKVILVAPWIDPKKHLKSQFFEFPLDPQLVEKTDGVTTLISLDDGQDVLTSVEILTKALSGMTIKQFTDRGHFTLGDMGTNQFPELLKII